MLLEAPAKIAAAGGWWARRSGLQNGDAGPPGRSLPSFPTWVFDLVTGFLRHRAWVGEEEEGCCAGFTA
ncbi:hypothetical protein NL676_038568 [Syzygium grande]|nr:hypothetical protein NL676_038568 [Syzygium grande]